MGNKTPVHVICMRIEDALLVLPDSIRTSCSDCQTAVWITLQTYALHPIVRAVCLQCSVEALPPGTTLQVHPNEASWLRATGRYDRLTSIDWWAEAVGRRGRQRQHGRPRRTPPLGP